MSTEHMIHILIAEDEPLILHNIAKKAVQAGSWVQIQGTAESGNEALAILSEKPVDILITDIEMPGINGLELTRLVRERFPHIKIIILSGYSNFEYARTAVHYGVYEYLLKPVSQTALTELLSRLKTEILHEHKSHRREILSMALNGSAPSSDLPSSMDEDCFYLLYLTLGNYSRQHISADISETYQQLWQKLSLEQLLSGVPGLTHTWIIDESGELSKFIILHIEKGRLSAGYLRLLLSQYLSKHLPDISFLLLLYAEAISFRDLHTSAKELRRLAGEYARPFAQEAFLSSSLPPERISPLTLRSELTEALRGITDIQPFLACTEKIMRDFLSRNCSARTLLNLTEDLFSTAQTALQADPDQCRIAFSSVCADFYCIPDPDTFLKLLSEQLHSLANEEPSLSSGELLCKKIVHYIGCHYCSRLSLNDLAEHFGYTPSYINRIFKNQLHLSPLQYITNLKIERAKELLLANPEMDIHAAASAVGYEDARYFSRVFKNETGMTPSAWATKGPEY